MKHEIQTNIPQSPGAPQSSGLESLVSSFDHLAARARSQEEELLLQEIKILYQTEDLVVVHKPRGFHVHQPEYLGRRVNPKITMLYRLRRMLNQGVYPVHRLDVATEGVMIFALNHEAASHLNGQFRNRLISKEYHCVVRGYVEDYSKLDIPLELDSTGEIVSALTEYWSLARTELSQVVGKRHSSARYSLLRVVPHTGRWHQIRRHFNRISHPIIGDREHGDSHHNRFFRKDLDLPGLWLVANKIKFIVPKTGECISVATIPSARWQLLAEAMGWSAATFGETMLPIVERSENFQPDL
jgi:tRNA pseudouridine65 synthase